MNTSTYFTVTGSLIYIMKLLVIFRIKIYQNLPIISKGNFSSIHKVSSVLHKVASLEIFDGAQCHYLVVYSIEELQPFICKANFLFFFPNINENEEMELVGDK
jgi:hypothetical protein